MPHYFFKQKWSASLWGASFFSEEILRHFIFLWRNNQALLFFSEEIMRRLKIFWRKKWGASLFLQKKNFIFFCRTNEVLGLVTARNLLMLFLQWKNQASIISSEKNQAPHYFFRKKSRASLFLQIKNEAPHYFFRTESAFFLEEIMKHLIF